MKREKRECCNVCKCLCSMSPKRKKEMKWIENNIQISDTCYYFVYARCLTIVCTSGQWSSIFRWRIQSKRTAVTRIYIFKRNEFAINQWPIPNFIFKMKTKAFGLLFLFFVILNFIIALFSSAGTLNSEHKEHSSNPLNQITNGNLTSNNQPQIKKRMRSCINIVHANFIDFTHWFKVILCFC